MPNRETSEFESALKKIDPNIDVQVWPNIKDHNSIKFAVCWNHPKGELAKFPNLEVISSYGAGVDQIIRDSTIDNDIRICRVLDPSLSLEMSEFIASVVLQNHRSLIHYYKNQENKKWDQKNKPSTSDTVIGILGLGQLGTHAAKYLANLGFKVKGWSKSKKVIESVETYDSSQLNAFLNNLDYLLCLLPLTSETKGFLNSSLFSKVNKSFYLINVARGEHLIEEDLLSSISEGKVAGAALDVFSNEPLEKDHSFWSHSKVIVTPHIASISNPSVVADQVMFNYRAMTTKKYLSHEVSRDKGY